MRGNWKNFRVWAMAICLCLLVMGIVIILWPELSAEAVCYILGALCVVGGIYGLLRYSKLGAAGALFRSDLTLGILSILFGVLLMLHPLGAAAFLPFIAGISMLMCSIFDIQTAIELRRFGTEQWLGALIISIISAIFALFLVLNPFAGLRLLMVFVGISLLISGVEGLYMLHSISVAHKQGKIERKNYDDAIDADWRPM